MTSKFRLFCYIDLKRQLGQIDAAAECLELAIREFIGLSKSFSDPSNFIQALSQKHGIRVDVFDLDRFVQHAAALRLIGVTQAFEVFLSSFIEDHPRVGSRKDRQKGETLLDFVVRKLGLTAEVRRSLKTGLEYRLYNYYRLTRNDIAHEALEQAAPTGPSQSLPELRAASSSNSEYARLSAPNELPKLTFDDYVLFTRSVKNLAAQLCQAGAFTDSEIIDWLEAHRSRKGSIQRQKNAIKTSLRIFFGIDGDYADQIARLIMGVGQ